jgi:hypothetical protein
MTVFEKFLFSMFYEEVFFYWVQSESVTPTPLQRLRAILPALPTFYLYIYILHTHHTIIYTGCLVLEVSYVLHFPPVAY